MRISFVENQTVFLFLAHVTYVLLLAMIMIVSHSPLVTVIYLEETLLDVPVLPRILIENQFRKVELARQYHSVHRGALIQVASLAEACAEQSTLFQCAHLSLQLHAHG